MIEYEALFTDINKEALRKLLQEKGAVLMRQEFLQKRVTLQLPEGHEKYGAFLRVRDEGDKITLSYKYVGGTTIDEQQEETVLVNDFDKTVSLLHTISCNSTSYEETTRELWTLDGAEVTIDGWPHLGTLVDVEGKSEAEVRAVSEKLNFDWSTARFCTAGTLYEEKYGLGPIDLWRKTGNPTQLTFNGKNPFI